MVKQNLRIRLLTSWGKWSTVHWKKALAIVLGITLVMIYGLTMVDPQMTYYSILPKKEKNVQELTKIVDNFPLASGIIAVIDGRNIKDPVKAEKRVKATIDALMIEMKKSPYRQYIIRGMGKTDRSLFKDHGLMLSKSEDIKRFSKVYSDARLAPLLNNMNNDFEKVYSGNGDKLSEDEDLAASQFKGLDSILELMAQAASGTVVSSDKVDKDLDAYLYGDSYMLSNDNRMGLFIIEPTFTISDLKGMVNGVTTIEKGVKKVAAEHGVSAGLTGLTVVGRDEMATSGKGLAWSSTLALLLILALMIFSFRMFSAPLVSGIPLVTGVIWTLGITGFTIHRLNIITAMYMVVLLGLGIDYAIHLLTAFIQEREDGQNFSESITQALIKSGNGIIVGALTTAAAFFMLTISKTEMLSELGIVAGIGIFCELFAMLLLIPPLLSYRNNRMVKKGKTEHPLFSRIKIDAHAASGLGTLLVKSPLVIGLIMVALVAGLSLFSGRIGLQTNIMKMEAKGLESINLQDEMIKEFGMAPDGMSIISSNPQELKMLSPKLKKLSSVKRVESIVPYITTDQEVKARTQLIEKFKEHLFREADMKNENIDSGYLLKQLNRLEDNFLELSDLAYMGNMNKISKILSNVTGRNTDGVKVRKTSFDTLDTLLKTNTFNRKTLADLQLKIQKGLIQRLSLMTSVVPVTVAMVPLSIRDSYVSKDGTKYLATIVPTQNPWNGGFRKIYTTQIKTVTNKATGMVLAGDQLSVMANQDGIRSSIGAVIIIFLILLIDFRNLKLALLTLIPLAASFLALFGIMGLAGIKFDFVNIIAVPLLIGIGIDDAVHINHRYLLEGKGSMGKVIGKTGTALLLTSLTTIIGFASFIPSPMRGMKSTGIVLSLAMAIAFINSVLLHPSIIIILTEKLHLNINPWRKK